MVEPGACRIAAGRELTPQHRTFLVEAHEAVQHASGPAEQSRLPQPYLPAGLRFKPDEGAGEVQTPLLGDAADTLRTGDRVWFRHAKAGELCEHVNELQLIDGETATPAPTYRGEGHAFLG